MSFNFPLAFGASRFKADFISPLSRRRFRPKMALKTLKSQRMVCSLQRGFLPLSAIKISPFYQKSAKRVNGIIPPFKNCHCYRSFFDVIQKVLPLNVIVRFIFIRFRQLTLSLFLRKHHPHQSSSPTRCTHLFHFLLNRKKHRITEVSIKFCFNFLKYLITFSADSLRYQYTPNDGLTLSLLHDHTFHKNPNKVYIF